METTNVGLENSRVSFDKQYDQPKTVAVGDEKFEIYHAAPGKKKTGPLLFGHGWPANPRLMRENLYELFNKGREVVFPYTQHGIELDKTIQESDPETLKKFAGVQLRKASVFLRTIEEEGLQGINGVAFSEGALHVVIAALMRPERFKNIVLVNPSGIMGKSSIFNFVLGAIRDTKTHAKRKLEEASRAKAQGVAPKLDEREDVADDTLAKHLKSGVWASIQEVASIPGTDILDALAKLKELGIGVSIIHSADDKIYDMQKVQKMVKAKHLDGFYSVKGTHTEFSANPKRYGVLIDSALTALEKKS